MVGVPGRSKGCLTCRKRKKKCDQQRPVCGNCLRANYVCSGYERDIIVIQVDQTGKGAYKPQDTRAQQKCLSLCAASPADIRLRDLNRTSQELEYFDAFWELYLPKTVVIGGREWLPFSGSGSVAKWAQYSNHYVPRSDVLRCALLALSTSKLGRAGQNKLLMQRGLELYGQALSLLGRELRKPGGKKHFGVLNSCRLLALYEQLNDVGTSATNWQGHVSGLMNLVQLHSPKIFAEPAKFEVFLEIRYNGILAALSQRKETFLSSPDWMIEPWKHRTKTPVDTAFDMLVQLPWVLQEWSGVDAGKNTPGLRERAKRLKERLWKLETELDQWYDGYTVFLEPLLQAEEIERLRTGKDNPAEQLEIPDILVRHGLTTLYAMTIYWTCCTMLYSKLDLVYAKFPPETSSEESRLQSPHFDIIKTATCLTRSTKFYLDPRVGIATTLSIAHATTCVARVLAAGDPKSAALVRDIEELKEAGREARSGSGYIWMEAWKRGMDQQRMSHGNMDQYRSDGLHSLP